MLQGLGGGEALVGVVCEELRQEVCPVWTDAGLTPLGQAGLVPGRMLQNANDRKFARGVRTRQVASCSGTQEGP